MSKTNLIAEIIDGAPDGVRRAVPYVAGKPIDELRREKGFGDDVQVIKLASNENPMGPSQYAIDAIQGCLTTLHLYPDAAGHELKKKLSEVLHVPTARILLGNGSENILDICARALLRPGDEVVLSEFSFPQFALVATLAGARIKTVPARDSFAQDGNGIAGAITDKTRMVIIGHPDNPTGSLLTADEIHEISVALPRGGVLIVDEAYHGLVTDSHYQSTLSTTHPLNDGERPIITTRTFSKAYGLAGLRVGYAVMPEELCAFVNRARLPFNVSSLALVGACAALDDTDHISLSLLVTRGGKALMVRECRALGLEVIEGAANFILVRTSPRKAAEVAANLQDMGIIVRPLGHPKLQEYLRVSVGLDHENEAFVKGLKILL